MTSSNFDEYITFKALGRKYDDSGKLIDRLLQDVPDGCQPPIEGYGEIKNMCAKVPSALVDRLDNVSDFLDISKREFIEIAVVAAIQRAEQIIKDSKAGDK